ncbi:galanin receptor type 1-like [Saccoglossus kowalevskii]|uniref:Cholecystokinin receptor type A-like n=1 Tax=Saccoglossus kowalevskii TaxID=10224 RepID=A0ABM0GKA5_SACKO|nr:PREDICTED: cholecystokinin receptor type A-like [Saccoglossus kowalevskii]
MKHELHNFTMTAPSSTTEYNDNIADNGTLDWSNDTLWFHPPDPPPMMVWLPTVIVYAITFFVGLTGNVLVLFSIQRCRRLQNVTNTFLASLATADLILIVIVIPFQTPTYFQWRWELGEFMCKALSYLTLLSSSCSVFMLTAMSVERYLVIVHPLLAKSMITMGRTRKVIVGVWLVAIIYSVPPLYFKKQLSWDFPNFTVYHTCTTIWPSDVWGKAYSLYLLFGMYIIPFLVMYFCYARIIHELWRSTLISRKMQNMPENYKLCSKQNGGGESRYLTVPEESSLGLGAKSAKNKQRRFKKKYNSEHARKQLIWMLLLVVLLFMICWGPLLWLICLIEFGYIPRYSHFKTYLAIAFNLLSYLNSCMNPICYAFISRTFRNCFFWAIKTCCRVSGTQDTHRPSATSSIISKGVSSVYTRALIERSSLADIATDAATTSKHVLDTNKTLRASFTSAHRAQSTI